jgi:hypothetical protein
MQVVDSASTGTSPPADTSVGSSNRADARVNLWQSRTRWMPFAADRIRSSTSQILPQRKGIHRLRRDHHAKIISGSGLNLMRRRAVIAESVTVVDGLRPARDVSGQFVDEEDLAGTSRRSLPFGFPRYAGRSRVL